MTLGLPFHTIKRCLRSPGRRKRGEAKPIALPLHRSPVRLGKPNRPSFRKADALDDSHRTVDSIARIVVMPPSPYPSKLTPMLRPSQITRTFPARQNARYLESTLSYCVCVPITVPPGTSQRTMDERNGRALPVGDGFGNG